MRQKYRRGNPSPVRGDGEHARRAMGPGAGPTPREEEQRKEGRPGGSVLDHSTLSGRFGKASAESSARAACEVPHVPEAGTSQWSCCAQALAGSERGQRVWPWSKHGGGLHSVVSGTRGHLCPLRLMV